MHNYIKLDYSEDHVCFFLLSFVVMLKRPSVIYVQ